MSMEVLVTTIDDVVISMKCSDNYQSQFVVGNKIDSSELGKRVSQVSEESFTLDGMQGNRILGEFDGKQVVTYMLHSEQGDLSSISNDVVSFVRESESMVSLTSELYEEIDETTKEVEHVHEIESQINIGLQTVSTNMEEMVNAIREITKTTNESSAMSSEALELVQSTNEIMKKLGVSSEGIGNVIKLISSITQQTNLLALNATIEAARAGEAGKGFAVVANEVKELARQTAKATLEIRKKIESIQSDTKSAINVIKDISVAVEKISGYAGNIAAAVEEQAATTDEVNRVVTEVENSSEIVKTSITNVTEIAKKTQQIAKTTQKTARQLGQTAVKVRKQFTQLMR